MNIRDYGLHNMEKAGVPVISKEIAEPCPNCKCGKVFLIQIDIEDRLLRGGKGTGTYMGCAACPWASPMAVVSTETKV
jgi:hypothetical protein